MISNEQYDKNGYTGLKNLGNTCFLNSCMQALLHTHELHAYMYGKNYQKNMKTVDDATIFANYKALAETTFSGNGVFDPREFVISIHKVATKKGVEIFTGWAQNDVTEFLRFVVDCFHNSVSRAVDVKISGKPGSNTDKTAYQCYQMLKTAYAKEYSEIMELFYGIFVSEIKSVDGNTIHSSKSEQYFILDLPMAPNMMDCFRNFIAPELLQGDNAWHNDKTGNKESAIKQMRFWNFPKILVITLKRFTNHMSKSNAFVDFPIEGLDLSEFAHDYNAHRYVYDLYAVCNHMGGVNGGHYNAFVKNKMGRWILFDDERVQIVDNPEHIKTPAAYCFFYRRR